MRSAVRRMLFVVLVINLVCLFSGVSFTGAGLDARDRRQAAAGEDLTVLFEVVSAIQRADYEGDRSRLRQLVNRLQVPAAHPHASRVGYWRGFARWRRAFNGFNDQAPREELIDDLQAAIREFDDALRLDGSFVDARVGQISCLQSLAFLHRDDVPRLNGFVERFVALFADVKPATSDNPRVHWVYGASLWYSPPGAAADAIAARQARAIETYTRGLTLAREQRGRVRGPLDPGWGEAELLMSLAWAHLNRTVPDVTTADAYAGQALALVPYWRYVRDLLIPQIRARKNSV